MTERRRKNTLLKRSVSVATLPGPSTGSNRTLWRNLWRTKQRKQKTQEAITKVWLSCHMWKDWARNLQEFWNLTASPQLTVLTERYGTLWFIQRIRSRMKRRPNWSIVCLAKNCSSSYVGETGRKFGLRIKEHKKEVDSFTAGTQTRASKARESSVTRKSAITDHAMEENHVIDVTRQKWSTERHCDRPDWKKKHFESVRHRCAWIGKQDHTNWATHGTRWFPGHVLHRAVNNQDVMKMSDGHQDVVVVIR